MNQESRDTIGSGSGPAGDQGVDPLLDEEAAASRLERALERIAARAHGAGASANLSQAPHIAARLDALIVRLRAALRDAEPGEH